MGAGVGAGVGARVGAGVGAAVGDGVGAVVGDCVGAGVGAGVGDTEGAGVGETGGGAAGAALGNGVAACSASAPPPQAVSAALPMPSAAARRNSRRVASGSRVMDRHRCRLDPFLPSRGRGRKRHVSGLRGATHHGDGVYRTRRTRGVWATPSMLMKKLPNMPRLMRTLGSRNW